MKKLILLIALSVLLYSAPGYATKRPGKEKAEMDKAFEGKKERERRAPGYATKRPGKEAEDMDKAFEGKKERERRAAALAKGELAQAIAAVVEREAKGELVEEAAKEAAEAEWQKVCAEYKEMEAEEAALASLQASVTKIEEQATTSCKRLVTILQAWKKRTEGYFVEESIATKFLLDRYKHSIGCFPLFVLQGPMLFECASEYTKFKECASEYTKFERESDIEHIIFGRAAAAQAAAARAQAYLVRLSATSSAEEAEAPVADNDVSYLLELEEAAERGKELAADAAEAKAAADDLELQGREARCSEIKSAEGVRGGSIPPGMQQEMCAISGRLFEEKRERLDQMEGVYDQFLKDEINHQAKVMDLVDVGQDQVQQLFKDVEECYGHFYKIKAGVYDAAHPTVDLAPAEALWTRADYLVSLVNNDADERRAQCFQTIALAQGNLDAIPTSLEEVEATITERVISEKSRQFAEHFESFKRMHLACFLSHEKYKHPQELALCQQYDAQWLALCQQYDDLRAQRTQVQAQLKELTAKKHGGFEEWYQAGDASKQAAWYAQRMKVRAEDERHQAQKALAAQEDDPAAASTSPRAPGDGDQGTQEPEAPAE